ncbi:MAG: beta-glucanase (GH16 family), partial [Flavobacteriales bacterium]
MLPSNKKINYIVLLSLLFLSGKSFSSEPNYTVEPDFIDHFDTFDDGVWNKTHLTKTDGGFEVDWDASMSFIREGNLVLRLEPKSGFPRYRAGDVRMKSPINPITARGYYETRAKVIAVNGVVSSFFTLNDTDRTPWSEVDFEWLKDGQKTHTNYIFSDGGAFPQHTDNGGHWGNTGGFDANEGFHTYGFDHREDRIVFYVDGEIVHTYLPTGDRKLYDRPTNIMMNVWTTASFMSGWAGPQYYGEAREALYDYVAYYSGGKPESDIVIPPTPLPYSELIEAEAFIDMNGIQTESSSEGTEDVGWIDRHDWLEYFLDVPQDGEYLIEYRVAAWSDDAEFQLSTDELELTPQSIPNTGGYQSWITISQPATLKRGQNTLRIEALSGGWNINWLEITLESELIPTPPPLFNLVIQAEDFGWMSGVKVDSTSDSEGGSYVGWVDGGDWLSYPSISIPESGSYTIEYRVAS